MILFGIQDLTVVLLRSKEQRDAHTNDKKLWEEERKALKEARVREVKELKRRHAAEVEELKRGHTAASIKHAEVSFSLFSGSVEA